VANKAADLLLAEINHQKAIDHHDAILCLNFTVRQRPQRK